MPDCITVHFTGGSRTYDYFRDRWRITTTSRTTTSTPITVQSHIPPPIQPFIPPPVLFIINIAPYVVLRSNHSLETRLVPSLLFFYRFMFSNRAWMTTVTVLAAISTAPSPGESSTPEVCSALAANGMAVTL